MALEIIWISRLFTVALAGIDIMLTILLCNHDLHIELIIIEQRFGQPSRYDHHPVTD